MLELILNLDIAVVFVVVFFIGMYLFERRNLLSSEWLGLNKYSSFLDQERTAKNQEILQLKQRIETLEKLITDPQEQLKRKIDAL
ncbi:hypothetical protein [Thalassotalea sediminis]|uniref:hypothetical protein n=1 Tax=Thalassotalea sediminis TaxID=1759089 RepID=UPI00257233C3|nr:hypothetical protein [Thalassotalea sediminis]